MTIHTISDLTAAVRDIRPDADGIEQDHIRAAWSALGGGRYADVNRDDVARISDIAAALAASEGDTLATEGHVSAQFLTHFGLPVVWLTYGPESDPERDTVSERAILEALAGLGLESVCLGDWSSGTDSRGGPEDSDPTLCWAFAPVCLAK